MSDEVTLDGTTDDNKYLTASVDYKDINFNQEFSASLAAGELYKVNVGAASLSNPDYKAARSWNLSGSDASIHTLLPQFTTVDDAESVMISPRTLEPFVKLDVET